jgi:hypothetical protein
MARLPDGEKSIVFLIAPSDVGNKDLHKIVVDRFRNMIVGF